MEASPLNSVCPSASTPVNWIAPIILQCNLGEIERIEIVTGIRGQSCSGIYKLPNGNRDIRFTHNPQTHPRRVACGDSGVSFFRLSDGKDARART